MLSALLPVRRALAHGFGERFTLPVPLWLYLYGAAAAVVVSFVLVGMFVGESSRGDRYRRYNLLELSWVRGLVESRMVFVGLRLLSVLLFLLVLAAGLFGEQTPSLNFAPTFVWVTWWVGLGYLTAFVGNIWPLVNPWKILFKAADGLARRAGLSGGLEVREPYPRRWGVWPALLFYFAFVWVELVYEGSATPRNIAFLTLVYSLVTWTGMAWFGKEVWLRQGEVFSVFFDILARFAPTEVRVADLRECEECSGPCDYYLERPRSKKARKRQFEVPNVEADCVNCYECFRWAEPQHRELNVRPWAVGLSRREPITLDRLAFIVFMLASVTMDGLMATPLWGRVQAIFFPEAAVFGRPENPAAHLLVQTLALMALPALFLGVYYGFSLLIRVFGGVREHITVVAAAFVYSLVPIALAYQVAHYYTLLLIQGQNIVPLLFDPFGWGWNLFGTAAYRTTVGVVGARFVWYSQVALIVIGRAVAVYLAHVIALRMLGNSKRAVRSQYPMLVLMVLYTVSSLWVLAQPVVEESAATGALLTPMFQLWS